MKEGFYATDDSALVERMGGQIWVDSEPGVGSTFGFSARFPIGTVRSSAAAVPREPFSGMRALIVDDNAASREILEDTLQSFGVDAAVASSGPEAISELEAASRAGQPYRLVLMDWKMPKMNGIEAMRRIRADDALALIPMIIMVSAYSREEAMSDAGDNPPEDFLIKPVSPSTLFETIMQLFGGEARARSRPSTKAIVASETMQRIRGARVLLVEDHELNQELAIEILNDAGLAVSLATNGQEALDLLNHQAFDGILMDIQMPVMDGYTATQEIRKQPQFAELPIIAMTANAMAGDRDKALDAGMNDHIAKPIDVEQALLTIAKWITPAQPVAERAATGPREPDAEELPVLPGVDTDAGLKVTQGKRGLYRKLLVRFQDSELGFEERFRGAIAAEDGVTATRFAHSLKGVAGNIGARDLQAAAAKLEQATANSGDGARIEECLGAVIEQLDTVLAGLASLGRESSTEAQSDTQQPLHDLFEQLTALLHDSDAEAVEVTERLLVHPAVGAHGALLKKLQQHIGEYDFEAALEVLQALRQSVRTAKDG